jgi:hypothetical protein
LIGGTLKAVVLSTVGCVTLFLGLVAAMLPIEGAADGICTRTEPFEGTPPDSKSGASANFATAALS